MECFSIFSPQHLSPRNRIYEWVCGRAFSIVSQTQADKNKSAAPGVKNSISFPLFVEPHQVSLGLKELLSPGFKLQPEAFFFFHIQACQSVRSNHQGICTIHGTAKETAHVVNSRTNKVSFLSFSDSLPTRLRRWLMVENQHFSALKCRNLKRTKKYHYKFLNNATLVFFIFIYTASIIVSYNLYLQQQQLSERLCDVTTADAAHWTADSRVLLNQQAVVCCRGSGTWVWTAMERLGLWVMHSNMDGRRTILSR